MRRPDEAMSAQMAEHHYFLQYHLYAVALPPTACASGRLRVRGHPPMDVPCVSMDMLRVHL
jgi:hypothetical protein